MVRDAMVWRSRRFRSLLLGPIRCGGVRAITSFPGPAYSRPARASAPRRVYHGWWPRSLPRQSRRSAASPATYARQWAGDEMFRGPVQRRWFPRRLGERSGGLIVGCASLGPNAALAPCLSRSPDRQAMTRSAFPCPFQPACRQPPSRRRRAACHWPCPVRKSPWDFT